MNAITKEEGTALEPVKQPAERAAIALGSTAHELKLRELALASIGIVAITNADGREEAHRAAMTLRTARTNITATGKAAREDATAFSKAVIAEERRLISIIEPEEERVFMLRDAWDAAEKAKEEARIAAERARADKIKADIQSIRDMALRVAGKNSVLINASCELLNEMTATDERFAEFLPDAEAAIKETLAACTSMLDDARTAEAAEAQRLADVAAADRRRAEEAAEVARQRAENERIANENAIAARKLADQQAALELEARQQREKAEANARAEQAERDRVAAETKRQLDAQQAQIAAQRQVLAEEQAAADKRRDDAIAAERLAVKVLADYEAALVEDAEFNARALTATREALESAAITPLAVLADTAEEPELSSDEIAWTAINAVSIAHELSIPQAIAHLVDVDFRGYAPQAVAV